jgi:hypothetical protein
MPMEYYTQLQQLRFFGSNRPGGEAEVILTLVCKRKERRKARPPPSSFPEKGKVGYW